HSELFSAITAAANTSATSTTSTPPKCICRNKEKHFLCTACTRGYPISVRRSRDGEESGDVKMRKDRLEFENKFRLNNNHNNNTNGISPASVESSSNAESTSSSCSSASTSYANYESTLLNLKPSPIPISSALIALLTLTKPTNKFRPPPNVNLANVMQNESNFDVKK